MLRYSQFLMIRTFYLPSTILCFSLNHNTNGQSLCPLVRDDRNGISIPKFEKKILFPLISILVNPNSVLLFHSITPTPAKRKSPITFDSGIFLWCTYYNHSGIKKICTRTKKKRNSLPYQSFIRCAYWHIGLRYSIRWITSWWCI